MAREERIAKIRFSDKALFLAARRENLMWLLTIQLYVLALVLFAISGMNPFHKGFLNAAGAVIVMLGIMLFSRACRENEEINEATRTN